MKRRTFLRNMGLGASGAWIATNLHAFPDKTMQWKTYSYGTIKKLEDAKNDEGYIAVRFAFTCDENTRFSDLKGSINVKNGHINRIKNYFFNAEEDSISADETLKLHITTESYDIIVVWLDEFSDNTQLSIQNQSFSFTFTLKDLVKNQEKRIEKNGLELTSNLLLHKETGKIKLEDAGGITPENDFLFTVMADPQGGNAFCFEDSLRTRMRIHNAFIEESVSLVNRLEAKPAFNMVVGDVTDAWGFEDDFKQMHVFLSKLKTPVLYEIGNHETNLHQKFSPGYNMEGFNNYFAAQKNINGLEKLLYSFDAGEWHFVVWPDPLRPLFWENHPHYFDWLERDLEQHKNHPTMVFQHVPVHPIGINPIVNYAESVFVKRTFVDILAKHGNVKYVLSGHVHIPVKSSIKTAVGIKGIHFINLPAAGYRPRCFGEPDYFGGPSQGVAIVDIKGKNAKIIYKTVTEEEYVYPDVLPEFNQEKHALWFHYKWELPAEKQFRNGNFEQGLKHWKPRFVYQEDTNVSNICEIRRKIRENSFNALYLFTKARPYQIPGQDRLPQDINRICQAVKIEPKDKPILEFEYLLDGENCDFNGYCGAYVWVEGYSGSKKMLNLMYSANKIWYNIGGKNNYIHLVPPVQLALDESPDIWQKATLNIAEDYTKFKEKGGDYELLNINKIILSFGIWNINDGGEQPFAAYFDNVKISKETVSSNINGRAIQAKEQKHIWWRGKDHRSTNIAGEHHYFYETTVNYKTKKQEKRKKR